MSRLAVHDDRTFGQRLADSVANGMGCWRFIIIQTAVVVVWMALNVVGFVRHWDEFPFILLNLLFSTQAAYAAPIIMMSQNRQAQKDREVAAKDDQEIGLLVDLQREQMTLLSSLHNHNTATREQIEAINEVLAEVRDFLTGASLGPRPRKTAAPTSKNPRVDHALPEVRA